MADKEPTLQDVLDRIDALTRGQDALTGELEIHGRETRELKAELMRELPEAVVAAVDRAFGARLLAVEDDVERLKRAAGQERWQ